MRSSQGDQPDRLYYNEENVAFSAVPGVQSLRNGQLDHTTDDSGQDLGGCELGGRLESGESFW